MVDIATLTADNQKLRSENRELTTEIRDLANRLEAAADELAKVKSLFFGRASEKLSVEERQQMRLFDETEQTADENQEQTAPTESAATAVPARTRIKPKRRPLPESLPREEVVEDISDQDKHCKCGHELVRIGEEVCERLDVIMPKVKVIRTVFCIESAGTGQKASWR